VNLTVQAYLYPGTANLLYLEVIITTFIEIQGLQSSFIRISLLSFGFPGLSLFFFKILRRITIGGSSFLFSYENNFSVYLEDVWSVVAPVSKTGQLFNSGLLRLFFFNNFSSIIKFLYEY